MPSAQMTLRPRNCVVTAREGLSALHGEYIARIKAIVNDIEEGTTCLVKGNLNGAQFYANDASAKLIDLRKYREPTMQTLAQTLERVEAELAQMAQALQGERE